MIYIYVVVAAIIASLIFKKSIWNPLNTNLKWFYIVFIALGLELAVVFGDFGCFSGYMTSMAYIIVIFFCIMNWKIKGFPFITAGASSNTLVVLLNEGKMPLSKQTLILAGLPVNTMDPKHVLMGAHTILPFLGDIVPINFLNLNYAASIGDLFIYTGLFLLIYLNTKKAN